MKNKKSNNNLKTKIGVGISTVATFLATSCMPPSYVTVGNQVAAYTKGEREPSLLDIGSGSDLITPDGDTLKLALKSGIRHHYESAEGDLVFGMDSDWIDSVGFAHFERVNKFVTEEKRTGYIQKLEIEKENLLERYAKVKGKGKEQRTPEEIETIANTYCTRIQNKHVDKIMKLAAIVKKLKKGDPQATKHLDDQIKDIETSIFGFREQKSKIEAVRDDSVATDREYIANLINARDTLEFYTSKYDTLVKNSKGKMVEVSWYRKHDGGKKAFRDLVYLIYPQLKDKNYNFTTLTKKVQKLNLTKVDGLAGKKTSYRMRNKGNEKITDTENKIKAYETARNNEIKDLQDNKIKPLDDEIGRLRAQKQEVWKKSAVKNKEQINDAKEELGVATVEKAEDLAKIAKKVGDIPVRIEILNDAIGTYQKAYDLTKNEDYSKRMQDLINKRDHPEMMGKGNIFASFWDALKRPFTYLAGRFGGDGKPSAPSEPARFLEDLVDPVKADGVVSGGLKIDNSTATQSFTNPTETGTYDKSAFSLNGEASINNVLVKLAMDRRTDNNKLEGYIFDFNNRQWVPDTEESQTKLMELLVGAGYKGSTKVGGFNVEWYAMGKLATTEREHTKSDRPGIKYHSDSKKFGGEGYLAVVFEKGRGAVSYGLMKGGGDYTSELALSAERELFGGLKAKLGFAHQTIDEQEAAKKVEKKNIVRTDLVYNGKHLPGFLNGTNLRMGVNFETDKPTSNYKFRVGPEKEIKGLVFGAYLTKQRNIDPSQRYGNKNDFGHRWDFKISKKIMRK